jgi:urease subunit beta
VAARAGGGVVTQGQGAGDPAAQPGREPSLRPGEIIPGEQPVALNPGRDRVTMIVTNTADRPVQVGSHYHFAAANPGLEFDRAAAWGRHLDIPAGTSVRFEPGVDREVTLVPLAGARVVPGLRVEYAGRLDARRAEAGPIGYGSTGGGATSSSGTALPGTAATGAGEELS